MFKDLLSKIYNGEFRPFEEIVPSDTEYFSKCRQQNDEFKYLSGLLGDDDKLRLVKLQNLISETQQMCEFANFQYGFRSGLILMYETLSDKNNPDGD